MRWGCAVSCLPGSLTYSLQNRDSESCNTGLAATVVIVLLLGSSQGADLGDSKGNKCVASVRWQCYYSGRRSGEVFVTPLSPTPLLTGRSHASDVTDYSYPATPNHSAHAQPVAPAYAVGDVPPHGPASQAPEHEYRPTAAAAASARHMALNRPQQPPPPPPPQAAEGSQAPVPMAPADYG